MQLQKKIFLSYILLMLLCFNSDLLFAQQNSQGLASNLNNAQGQRNILEDQTQWEEIESERAIYSSTYTTPDGRIIIHYSKEPLNYYNASGKLVPIICTPTKTTAGLSASNQPFPVSVLENGAVEISTVAETKIRYSDNCKINGVATSSSALNIEGNIATMNDIAPGINKTFDFRFNSLKYNYVLTHPISNSSADFIIEEDVTLPEGATIKPDKNYGQQNENGWAGVLSVTSSKGEEISRINGAVCFDANNNYCTAAYKVENINGVLKLKIILPNKWLSDASRIYPITIDPLVTGPTSTWLGSYIASCIAPASSADSIAVTIPAQITVTGFFVSGSYYASPFTTAVMSDGNMFFSTRCNTSTSFTVAAPTGSSPGTGYLTAYDLHTPLLCCYPQSCSARTIYLTMHISRTGPGAGCNTTYIYHDPFSGYPFSAYVEGHKVESYGPGWNVSPSTICSNVCNLTGTVYMRYGVPPYTITHPWMTGSVTTTGAPAGCSAGSISKVLNLTNPACPLTCDTVSVLSVPAPTVRDACGIVLTGLVPKVIHIKETPTVTATPNPTTECSDVPFNISLSSCIAGSTINWSGHGSSGTGTNITDAITNSGTSPTTTNYLITATSNGCISDTVTIVVNTDPLPVANFSITPQSLIVNTPGVFTDNTSVYGGTATSWNWDFGDGTFATTQNPVHSYPVPGKYTVCLSIQTSDGCVDNICNEITIIPAEIILPNVITPNGDNQNEQLYFKYLEYFGSNTLKVFDRWGKIVYEKANYTNDWNASKVADGTYYYILTLESGKVLPGYVQIIHN